MNEAHRIEVVTASAGRIITSIQNAIFSSMEAAAQGVEMQTQMAAAFQKLEAQEAILDWLVQRRIDQETKLEDSSLRPAQQAIVRRKIQQIDDELSALMATAGIEPATARKAIGSVVHQPRIPRGEPGAGRFLPVNGS